MHRQQSVRGLLVLLAALVIGGCVSKQSAPTRFYVLEPLPATTAPLAEARRDPPLSVDLAALRLPQYLERPQVVTRVQPGQLTLDDYHHWGENLAKNVMRVLARNLSLLLATSDVTVFTRRPAGPVDGRVDIEVLQFERGPDSRVLLAAQWWLLGGAAGAQPVSRLTELASGPLPADAGVETTVAAMGELLGRFSVVLAGAIAAGAER